ncbi:hypothetical protein ACJ5NV_07080 [Loktanella agnita]|uniref:hypothetical protein n=1 Tax=Loktanella agnita TaxID=287097 RepID=UPI003986859A
MIRIISLLLPALIPSWRFFKAVEPSPRLQWAVFDDPAQEDRVWQEYRPRPQRVVPLQVLGRLFWNPSWNEYLFMVTLTERLIIAPTDQVRDEILRRIAADLPQANTHLQFRLVHVSRQAERITREITYLSDIRSVP